MLQNKNNKYKTGNLRLNVTLRHVRKTMLAVKKQVLYILSVCFALVVQHAMHTCHIVICCLSDSTIFFHIISRTARYKEVTERDVCVLIFSATFSRKIPHYKN